MDDGEGGGGRESGQGRGGGGAPEAGVHSSRARRFVLPAGRGFRPNLGMAIRAAGRARHPPSPRHARAACPRALGVARRAHLSQVAESLADVLGGLGWEPRQLGEALQLLMLMHEGLQTHACTGVARRQQAPRVHAQAHAQAHAHGAQCESPRAPHLRMGVCMRVLQPLRDTHRLAWARGGPQPGRPRRRLWGAEEAGASKQRRRGATEPTPEPTTAEAAHPQCRRRDAPGRRLTDALCARAEHLH